jgi:hypothetical protein
VTGQDPARRPIEILGEIEDGRADGLVDGVAQPIVGLAQGDDGEAEPPALESRQLVGDERLGNARVALDDDSEGSGG